MTQLAPQGDDRKLIGRSWIRAVTCAATLTALILVFAAPPADARWTHISSRRSSIEPHFACPAVHGRAHCELISDPTRGLKVRGPLKAGAITAGPEQQVSPPLSGRGVDGGFSPEDLREAYDLPSTSAGSGETVAVVDAYNDPNAQADLKAYRSFYSLPECTEADGCLSIVNQSGGSSPPANNAGWSEEISLDLDMVSAICPNCHILLVEANSEEIWDLAAAEEEAVKLDATEISNSYGAEVASEPAYAAAYDHPGIPITAAAGDEGYGVEWPAASPHVIAVGGTALEHASNARGWSESAWSGTGSGCSGEPKPAWQHDTGCSHRTNNDVAAVASVNTPVSVYDSYKSGGTWILLGGTSVATPIVASAMALASAHTRTLEGAKALYVEAALSGKGTLDDVTSGMNGNCGNYLCDAGPGYDGPTGLGSLEGAPNVPLPAFLTAPATNVTKSEATLNAAVEPNGAEVRECSFEYRAHAGWSSTACSPSPGSGTRPVSVSASLSSLEPSTEYHFRVSGSYPGGSGSGAEEAFTTTAGPPPTVVTEAASSVAKTTATLNATVNPQGMTTTCVFEYGTTNAYGLTKPCAQSPGAGKSPVAVSASITSLSANTVYDFRISATNREGTRVGGERTFTTLPEAPVPPTVSEVTVTSLTQNDVQVRADVDPEGSPVTSCTFEYGLTTSYTTSTECTPPLPGEGTSQVAVSAHLDGLTAASTYHVRVRVKGAGGSAESADETFTTLPNPPSVQTEGASMLTQTSAVVNASVGANGGTSTGCEFQYGTSEGSVGEHSAECASAPEPTRSSTPVAATLAGLLPDMTYSYRIVASNLGGTSDGAIRTFTTASPSSPSEETHETPLESGVTPIVIGPEPTPTPSPTASLASTKLLASAAGTLQIELNCAASGARCEGRITLETLASAAAHLASSVKQELTLASRSFALAAGQHIKLTIHLAKQTRALLSRVRVLSAKALIMLHLGSGESLTIDTVVTIHASRPARGARSG